MKRLNRDWFKVLGSGALVVALGLLPGCSVFAPPVSKQSNHRPSIEQNRALAVFFDGTNNDGDRKRETNVHLLFRTMEDDRRLHSFYIEGVGAGGKPIGLASAWGFGMRVRAAYAYLLLNYRPGDRIYLFGFSRGAFAARALAAMLHHAGLQGAPFRGPNAAEDAKHAADLIFDAHKCSTWKLNDTCASDDARAARQSQLKMALHSLRNAPDSSAPADVVSVPVEFMGLWDTVEAMGWIVMDENVDVPNSRYGDQLCNVKHAAHALSLDDNRATVFTPVLLTRRHLVEHCSTAELLGADWRSTIKNKVEEAYFAGAHSDVGGGYTGAQGQLSGASLNWIVAHAVKHGFPRPPVSFPADPLAATHDPQADGFGALLYPRRYRNIDAYADSDQSSSARLKFHCTLVAHLGVRRQASGQYGGSDPQARDVARPEGRFAQCFSPPTPERPGFVMLDRCPIEVIDDAACR